MKSHWEMGYNAMSGEFINMIEGGVIDPKKVTRSGLMNSCSIAGMVLTTQAVITEIPKRPSRRWPRCRIPTTPLPAHSPSKSKIPSGSEQVEVKGAAIRGCFV